MAEYYNRSPGTIALTLKSGQSVMFPGKTWVAISAEDDGSESLLRALRLGHLVRFPKSGQHPAPAQPEPAKKEEPAKASTFPVEAGSQPAAHVPTPTRSSGRPPASPVAVQEMTVSEKTLDVAATAAPAQQETPSVPSAGSTDETASDKTPDNRRRKV